MPFAASANRPHVSRWDASTDGAAVRRQNSGQTLVDLPHDLKTRRPEVGVERSKTPILRRESRVPHAEVSIQRKRGVWRPYRSEGPAAALAPHDKVSYFDTSADLVGLIDFSGGILRDDLEQESVVL